ncbi:hypothetical protein [Streptomyces sp. NPDC005125]
MGSGASRSASQGSGAKPGAYLASSVFRDNLIARITEAEREGWLGEVEGLQASLAGANDKIAQIDQRPLGGATVDLGLPAVRNEER